MSFVEVAGVASAWKYLGSRKTGRARGLLGTRFLSSRVSPSRVPSFLAPTDTGYVEVALSSNFMVFPIISAFLSLGRRIHTVVRRRSVQPHRLPSNLRSLDLFANHLRQTARRILLEGGRGRGIHTLFYNSVDIFKEVMLHGTIRNNDF